MTGDGLIRGFAWLALTAYATSVATQLQRPIVTAESSDRGRWLWTVGYALMVMHVGCSYAFRLNWSHDAAYAHTARRTAETLGLDWGGGVYFNDVLLLIWTADVIWWWLAPTAYAFRPRSLSWLVHGYFAFMAFNAAVVFGSGALRWVAAAVSGLLIVSVIGALKK